MPRQLAISDIHGCNRTFLALLDFLAFGTEDELFLLGDYVNRGPNSRGVIDTIWELQGAGYRLHCLQGNHEELTYVEFDNEKARGWMGLGDPQLLQSFGVKHLADVPAEYIDWMRGLAYYHETPGFILVHAGLNFDLSDPLDGKSDMLTIRDWYDRINRDWLGDRLIVHGHDPLPLDLMKNMLHHHNRMPVQNIDAGAVIRNPTQFMHLCAFDLTNRELFFQPNVEEGYAESSGLTL